jgi:hypothetical protein
MSFMVDTPYTTAYIRNEFLYDQQQGKGEFTLCTVFGFRAEPMRTPYFSVMLECGAQWARIPIHALCSKPCPEMSLQIACWWDSFSRFCEVREMQFLRNHRVKAIGRDGVQRPGVYLFSVFWANGGWSEIPDQSKDHHIIALDSGHWIAYPNNRLLWQDPSWIHGEIPRGWKSPSQNYSVEALP